MPEVIQGLFGQGIALCPLAHMASHRQGLLARLPLDLLGQFPTVFLFAAGFVVLDGVSDVQTQQICNLIISLMMVEITE